jgi:membrane protein
MTGGHGERRASRAGIRPRVRAGREVTRTLAREWRDDRLTGLAAEVAFFGVLSAFPGLIALAAMLGWLDAIVGGDVSLQAEAELIALLERVLTDEAQGTVEAAQDLFNRESPGMLTLGLVGLIWGMSRGFAAIIRALDDAYDVEERRTYIGLRLTAISLALGTLIAGTIVLAMLVVGPLFGSGRDVAELVGLGEMFTTFWDTLRIPVVFVFLTGFANLIFHFGPNHRTTWRSELPGAAMTAVLWVVVSGGFSLYLDVAGGGNEMFGVLGGGLSVLVWFYLLSVGLLLGGELNAILGRRRGLGSEPARDRHAAPGLVMAIGCDGASGAHSKLSEAKTWDKAPTTSPASAPKISVG